MSARPSRRVLGLELVALVGAIAVAVWANRDSSWDLPLFAVLLTSSVVGDLTALDAPTRSGKISSSFLAIFVAIVLLGETPAAAIGVATILVGWLRFRYREALPPDQCCGLRLVPAALRDRLQRHSAARPGTTHADGRFYLLVFALFAIALVINYTITIAYLSYIDRTPVLEAADPDADPGASLGADRRADRGRDHLRVPASRIGHGRDPDPGPDRAPVPDRRPARLPAAGG